MVNQQDFQQQLFEQLRQRYGSKRVLTESMAVLGLRKGAVYKRMNGETALTATELVQLSTKFQVSLDTLTANPRFMAFRHPFMEQRDSFTFLDRFRFYMGSIQEDEKSQFAYLANELPVFY
ncbi:MAG: hypothetical protein AAGJ82_07570, partial [Bacteroidota bacterium]